jgi:uncharacterized membrane protein
MYPLLGAGLGGFSAHEVIARNPGLTSRSPLTAALAAALVSGAAGGVYHASTKDKRRQAAREAVHGAQLEMEKFPRPKAHAVPDSQKDQGTASAATPTLLATAPTNW